MNYLSPDEQDQLNNLRQTDGFVDEALCQLDRIHTSEIFKRLRVRLKDFLGFAVSKRLLGLTDQIKELTIAVSVYKIRDYSPTENHTVREAARELRRKLTEYYGLEGRTDPVVIEIPKGTYVPDIRDRRALVAVSLFENWNLAGVQDHLCAIVSDEIVDRLVKTSAVRAIRVAALVPREQGNQYGLRGTVECRPDNTVRLNTSLIRLDVGHSEWGRSFEGQRDDLLKLSQQVADALAAELEPSVTGQNAASCPSPQLRRRPPQRARRLQAAIRVPKSDMV